MNLLTKVQNIAGGVEVIAGWLGDGGAVVEQDESQSRADVCNGKNPTGKRCVHNVKNYAVTKAVALTVKKYLSVKNAMNLRVVGEKELGRCKLCGCVLRLQVHEPQEKVVAELTNEEKSQLPEFCWKLR